MTAARLRGIHVAVTGDDTDALAYLAESLKRDGALVTAHGSARSLARVMQLLVVNVLVVDLSALTSESLGLIRKVRALPSEEGGRVPIVALYAGPEHDEPRLVAEDVDSVVRKPANNAEIARAIAAVFAAAPERVRDAPKRFDPPARE